MMGDTFNELLHELPRVMISNDVVHVAIPGFGPETDYTFRLDRCDTPVKLLHWVNHLSRKTWVTTQHIKELVTIVSQHFGWEIFGIA